MFGSVLIWMVYGAVLAVIYFVLTDLIFECLGAYGSPQMMLTTIYFHFAACNYLHGTAVVLWFHNTLGFFFAFGK